MKHWQCCIDPWNKWWGINTLNIGVHWMDAELIYTYWMYSHANVQYHKPLLVPSHHYSICLSTFVRIVALNIQTLKTRVTFIEEKKRKHTRNKNRFIWCLRSQQYTKANEEIPQHIRNICILIPSHWKSLTLSVILCMCIQNARKSLPFLELLCVCEWSFAYSNDSDKDTILYVKR